MRVCKNFFLYFGLLVALAQSTDVMAIGKIPGERPKLVVNIVIDGLRSDYLDQSWIYFTESGFRRLVNGGAYCRTMTFPYLNVGTSADYASIFTGAYPSDHGICGESFWNPKTRKSYSCVFDESSKGLACSDKVSPQNILTSTIIDELRLNTRGRAKVATIALNPEEAVIMAGHGQGQVVWLDSYTGKWASSNYYNNMMPSWAVQMNGEDPTESYIHRNWTNMLIGAYYNANSTQSQMSSSFFAYNFDNFSQNKAVRMVKSSPFINEMVRDLAVRAVKDEYMGVDDYPDILNLEFTVKAFDQTTSGVLTAETQDMYYRLDKELSRLMEDLDGLCGASQVLYVISSPQSEYVSPDFMKSYGIPSGYFVSDRSMALLNTYLMAIYGQGDFVMGYSDRQIFLDKKEIENKKLNIEEVENKVATFMARFEGVQSAYTANELMSATNPSARLQKAKNVYDKNKSGDVFIFLLPGWVDVRNESEKVGLSSRINNYAPLIISGWHTKKRTINRNVSVIDVAPTLCNLLLLPLPNYCEGVPLSDVVE